MTTKSRIQPGDGDPRHGTVNGYTNLGCRCADCRFVWADDRWRYMQNNPEQRARHNNRNRLLKAKKRAERP